MDARRSIVRQFVRRRAYGRVPSVLITALLCGGGAVHAGARRPAGHRVPRPPASLTCQAPGRGAGPPRRLTVLEREGVERSVPSQGRMEAGLIDPILTPVLERVFLLRNETDSPIAIDRVHVSCGCEQAVLQKSGRTVEHPIVASGEEITVRLVARLNRKRAGISHVSAWVAGKEGGPPLATLEIVIRIQETMTFAPGVLDFGKLNVGMARSLPFTVTCDARLLEKGRLPVLRSSNPAVTVSDEPGEQRIERNGRSLALRRYRVTISPKAPAGRISGALYLLPPSDEPKEPRDAKEAPAPTAGEDGATAVPEALMGLLAPLAGEIKGAISAAPGSVAFGVVTEGKERVQQLVLSGASVRILERCVVTSDSPALRIVLRTPETAGKDGLLAMRLVDVFLRPNTPPGALQTSLRIVTPDGATLRVPVVAEVRKSDVTGEIRE